VAESASCDWKLIAATISDEDEKGLERLRLCFVRTHALEMIEEARAWIARLKEEMSRAVELLGARGVLLSKEMKSFVNDPERHLVKKLFIYSHDLVKGKMGIEEYERTALAAIRTSIKTNMRSIYESWVLLAIVNLLIEKRRPRLIYPEHGSLLLERSGRQRSGRIPPNFVLHIPGHGAASFFLEAPRPVSWGDTRDLARAWKLYVALRPDMLVYGGLVTDIVSPDSNPPIKRPDIVIEVKELSDWYTRSREVRGPFAATMTAEEWRNRWIRGLWSGLADVLGVESPEKAYEHVKKKRGLRLTEVQIVKLYARIYKPKRLYLVSKELVPETIASELESTGVIRVVDAVGFNRERLGEISDAVASIASYEGLNGLPLFLSSRVLRILESLATELGVEPETVMEAAIRLAAEHRGLIRAVLR